MGVFRSSYVATALLLSLLALTHYAEANRQGSLLQPNEEPEDEVAIKAAVVPSGTGTPTASSSKSSTLKSSPATKAPPPQRSSSLLQPLTTKEETTGTTPEGGMQEKTSAMASALGSSPSSSSTKESTASLSDSSSSSASASASSSFTRPGDFTDGSSGSTTGTTGSAASSMTAGNEGKTITSSGDERGSLRPIAAQVNETSSTVGLSGAIPGEGSTLGTSLKPSSASGATLGLTPVKETSALPSSSLESSKPSSEGEHSSSSTKGLMRATPAPVRTTPRPNAYTSKNNADGLASRITALNVALAPALALLLATWPR